ncbi:MAG: PP2C family protein-serine/threonine phosphatase [Planctomycetota bacterium]
MIHVRSIRFRLLAAVNAAIAILVGVFLAVDYQQEITRRVAEKHVALEDETKTLLPAVMRVRMHGEVAVQRYIDDVCGRMRDRSSPGHHIAVEIGDSVLQAVAHHRASAAILAAMKQAASSDSHRARVDDEELVVGSIREADTTVYISEYMSNIRRAARERVFARLPRILLLMLVTAIVINLVFLRMAARPLRKLVDTVRRIARGEVGLQTGPFKSEEFNHLAGAVNSMSTSLAENERQRRAERLHARHIQEQLLPGHVKVSGLRLAPFLQPAEDVAGDYYDIISMPDGACLVCIADVTGHGVPAALSATMLKAYLQDAAVHHGDPGDILRFLNHRLAGVSRTDNFATMFLGVFSPDRKKLSYANAGHGPGLLLRCSGQLDELPSTGLILGVLQDADWKVEERAIGPGDRLLLTTDGVTEAMNEKEQLFGKKRLIRELEQCEQSSAEECVSRIQGRVREHCGARPPTDDMTLLAIDVEEGTCDVTPQEVGG